MKFAIVDYGVGNLHSVRHACAAVGVDAVLAPTPDALDGAAAIIVPGVGAFGSAIETLRRLGFDSAIRVAADSGKIVVGICLGMQLFCRSSQEFGSHEGLGLVDADVVRFPDGMMDGGIAAKVPEVGWNAVSHPGGATWAGSPLEGIPNGEPFYFVHSYYVVPRAGQPVLATTSYGEVTFASCIGQKNVFACQFHPERSGPAGLHLYRNIVRMARE